MARTNPPFTKAFLQTSRPVYRNADKAFTHFAKWVTTDHTGFSQAMNDMPKMGFVDSLKHILIYLAISVISVLISGLLIFILITLGLPLLIHFLLQ